MAVVVVCVGYDKAISSDKEAKRNHAHSAKYQAPITPAHVVLNTPRATPQLHSQTPTVPTIAQFAQARTCHSRTEGSSIGR